MTHGSRAEGPSFGVSMCGSSGSLDILNLPSGLVTQVLLAKVDLDEMSQLVGVSVWPTGRSLLLTCKWAIPWLGM